MGLCLWTVIFRWPLQSSLTLAKQEGYSIIWWEQCLSLCWAKTLVKSFPLESRPFLWRVLWAYFIMIILRLLLLVPKGEICWIFIVRIGWSSWWWNSQKSGCHLRFDPRSFPLSCYPALNFSNLLKLLYKCFYNFLVPATSAPVEDVSCDSVDLPIAPSFECGEGISPQTQFSDGTKRSHWFSVYSDFFVL